MMNASCFYRPMAAALIGSALAIGCASPRYGGFPSDQPPIELASGPEESDVRSLPMFAGSDGSPLRWDDLLAAADWAHIILVGEEHDDGTGHAVQRAIVEDVLRLGALSMEMLERDEQMLAD